MCATLKEFVLDVKARPDYYKELAKAYYLIGAPFCMLVLLLIAAGLAIWARLK